MSFGVSLQEKRSQQNLSDISHSISSNLSMKRIGILGSQKKPKEDEEAWQLVRTVANDHLYAFPDCQGTFKMSILDERKVLCLWLFSWVFQVYFL
ncbi:hypothetical protein HJFPF1_09775 [Paramyrothecium foliicola]|nr:hypothetical protein HJFPF1_09775 [Paramyrothecium foliicola]